MTTESVLLRTELSDRVLTITMIDESNRNTLGNQMVGELIDAFDRAEENEDVRVVVLTNSGTVFCAGANLNEQTADDGAPPFTLADLFLRVRNSRLPFVGRIAGHAVAGGLGLAAVMDLSVAVDTAKHGFTEVRIGVAPAMISVVCLPKMTQSNAAEAMLRGHRFLAPEAVRLGLINKAVPVDRLDAEVDAMVADLLLGGPNALAATKRLFDRLPSMPMQEALTWTAEMSGELFRSGEGQAGMSAYLEKRSAPWAE